MTMENLTVKNIEEFTDYAQIVDVYGQGCNYPTKKGVDGFQVDMDIEYAINGEKNTFHIVLQSKERVDNLPAYSGYEMAFGQLYGCDYDESYGLREELESNDMYEEWESIRAHLIEVGEKLCKQYLLANLDDEEE